MANTILVLITCLLSASSPSLSYHQDIEFSTSRTLKEEPKAPDIHCSRERSRLARRAINEYVAPFVERERYQLPIQCRLHPLNDIFRDHEEHKVHADLNDWQCGYCKKTFRAERFLDQHFDNRHYNLLNVSHGKCMADLCGALHCDLMMETKAPKTKCNPAAAARNRHMCEEIADSCFPLNKGQSATRLRELFLRQFCDAHACSGGKKPFSRGGRGFEKWHTKTETHSQTGCKAQAPLGQVVLTILLSTILDHREISSGTITVSSVEEFSLQFGTTNNFNNCSESVLMEEQT